MALEQQMLDELKNIRELLTPKPAPPAPSPAHGLWAEFREFLGKGGVLGLAIGFIMGTAIGRVVSGLVTDIIMPLPSALVPGGDWRMAIVSVSVGNGIHFAIGDFVGILIDFLIIAGVIFMIARYARRMGLR